MPPASATFFLHRERSYPPGQVQADDVCDDDDGRVDVAELKRLHDDVCICMCTYPVAAAGTGHPWNVLYAGVR